MSRTGTDCVEDLFSELGSMVKNKRVYSFLGAVYGASSRNLVQSMASTGHVVVGGRNKRLKDAIWKDDATLPDADMGAHLDDETMTTHWDAGGEEARANIIRLGADGPWCGQCAQVEPPRTIRRP